MTVDELFGNYQVIIYFSWFDYITDKHLSLLADYKDKITVVERKDLTSFEMKSFDPDETLLLAQTSCKEVNAFFSRKVLDDYRKVLIQDGMRLHRKNSYKFKVALLLDKLNSQLFSNVSTTYYKSFYDYYILTTRIGCKEAEHYNLNPEKTIEFIKDKNNSSFSFNDLNKKQFLLIDQPMELFYKSNPACLYEKLCGSLRAVSYEGLYVKHHPSQIYNEKYRKGFIKFSGELTANRIYITFYSTMGLELLQKGKFVFFLREFMPEQFILDNINYFIVDSIDLLCEKINGLTELGIDYLNKERDKLIDELL